MPVSIINSSSAVDEGDDSKEDVKKLDQIKLWYSETYARQTNCLNDLSKPIADVMMIDFNLNLCSIFNFFYLLFYLRLFAGNVE